MKNRKIVTVNLGAEYDATLWNKLIKEMDKLGGTRQDESWGVAGSQEVASFVIDIKGIKLVVESETYIGLTITGEKWLIDEVALNVKFAHT